MASLLNQLNFPTLNPFSTNVGQKIGLYFSIKNLYYCLTEMTLEKKRKYTIFDWKFDKLIIKLILNKTNAHTLVTNNKTYNDDLIVYESFLLRNSVSFASMLSYTIYFFSSIFFDSKK